MNRRKLSIIITIFVIVIAVGVKVVVARTPIKLDGPAWRSVQTCAMYQKRLYQTIEHYKEEHGQFPDAIEDFRIDFTVPVSGDGTLSFGINKKNSTDYTYAFSDENSEDECINDIVPIGKIFDKGDR